MYYNLIASAEESTVLAQYVREVQNLGIPVLEEGQINARGAVVEVPDLQRDRKSVV